MVAQTRSAAAHPPAPASTPDLVVDPASDPPRLDELDTASLGSGGLRRRDRDVSELDELLSQTDKGEEREGGGSSVAADDDDDGASMMRWGIALVVGSASCFALGLWSMLVGPLCGPTGFTVIDALVQDTHYKYLVVLLVPVTVCFVIVNWWGLKIFRHA